MIPMDERARTNSGKKSPLEEELLLVLAAVSKRN